MKNRILILPAILFIFASCKINGVSPLPTTSTDNTNLHTITLSVLPQTGKASLIDSTLSISYTENVNVMLTPQGLQQSYAVHLLEDFSSSALANFDYTTVTQSGDKTFNWVDDNLNNVILKTVTDTTVNGTAMKNIHVIRSFNMVKTYATVQKALTAETVILNTKTDVIKFSSFVFFDKVYPSTSFSAPITYTIATGSDTLAN